MRKNLIPFVSLVALALLPASAIAQKPVEKSHSVSVKTTIEAIDYDSRTITLKDKDGNLETLIASPEIKRFNELKAGDTVTFKYKQAIAVRIAKEGEPVAASSSGEPTIARGTGAKPSGTISEQVSAHVLVKAVDAKAGSVTVAGEDGRTRSLLVEDKGLLKNVKAGDKIVLTYTEALLISVE
jgi:Cu/Ag efflux protein CusF